MTWTRTRPRTRRPSEGPPAGPPADGIRPAGSLAVGPEDPEPPEVRAENVDLAYDGEPVLRGFDLEIPRGELTAVIGPNGCGKSTLLRAWARLLRPTSGEVLLDGRDIHALRTTDVARRLALLPQQQRIPAGATVTDLVARGRFAHQGILRRWSPEDDAAVAAALTETRLGAVADRPVDALSGGQRQRVWIAVVLAQATPLLLLDEPTTYLDIAHQMDVLETVRRLHRSGRTIVAVLHDLAHAARFATRVVAMRDGEVRAHGTPAEVFTAEILQDVFGWPCHVVEDPVHGTPLVIPLESGRDASGLADAEAGPGAGAGVRRDAETGAGVA
jgi:ABC-type cobalamin/Fe3+-siderophores transport system ATPase subunit